MKYIGENAIKKLISLIKGDLAAKQPTITASGLLKGNGAGNVTAAVAGTDYVLPSTLNSYAKKSEVPAADTPIPDSIITSIWNSVTV